MIGKVRAGSLQRLRKKSTLRKEGRSPSDGHPIGRENIEIQGEKEEQGEGEVRDPSCQATASVWMDERQIALQR